MKKTKILSFILSIMILVSALTTSIQAASTYTNQTVSTNTSFQISDSGLASVSLCYAGREGLMTNAKIVITISKRTYLFFWDVREEATFYSKELYYIHLYETQLYSKGTYKCEVQYIISGTGGADDILTFEDTETY